MTNSNSEQVFEVTVENGSVPIPDALWEGSMITENTRFDLLDQNGALVLRPCPHEPASDGVYPVGHADLGENGYCGMVKWMCAAGCGTGQITEHEDSFPDRWIEVSVLRSDLCTESTASFCSAACAGMFLSENRPLPKLASRFEHDHN